MDMKQDLNKSIVELAARAITAREVMEFMREKEERQAYGEWTARWMTLTDVLSLLTGRGVTKCVAAQDLKDIIKEYSVDVPPVGLEKP